MKRLALATAIVLLARVLGAAECPGSHCSTIGDQVNAICKSDGFSGTVVYVQMPNGVYCYCKCSCLAYGTPVAYAVSSSKPIEEFKVGDTVLVAGPNRTWVSRTVKFSDGTPGNDEPFPYAIYVSVASGSELIVTPDHPFLLANGTLKKASTLTPSDQLVGADFKPVAITGLAYGSYTGGIHNISTSVGQPGEPLNEHLINTAGVVSGDYYAQLYLTEDEAAPLPKIGSPEYLEIVKPTALKNATLGIRATLTGAKFTPHKPFQPPAGAVPFLPREDEQPMPGMLAPLDDTVPLEIAQNLVNYFKRFYTNVTYHIEWADNTVNAYAWVDGAGGRHVALLGGLIRHRLMGEEGIGLVLAHELGHHFGGAPLYPNSPLSCEGQADYWGASTAMRVVWYGQEYFRQMTAAQTQLYNLFSGGLRRNLLLFLPNPNAPVPLAGCGHPPAACRLATYQAATRLSGKPDCAG